MKIVEKALHLMSADLCYKLHKEMGRDYRAQLYQAPKRVGITLVLCGPGKAKDGTLEDKISLHDIIWSSDYDELVANVKCLVEGLSAGEQDYAI